MLLGANLSAARFNIWRREDVETVSAVHYDPWLWSEMFMICHHNSFDTQIAITVE